MIMNQMILKLLSPWVRKKILKKITLVSKLQFQESLGIHIPRLIIDLTNQNLQAWDPGTWIFNQLLQLIQTDKSNLEKGVSKPNQHIF